MKQVLKSHLLFALLCITGLVRAGHEVSNNRLNSPSLVYNSVLSVADNKYALLYAAVPGTINFKDAQSKTRVRIGLDNAYTTYTSAYNMSFVVQLQYQTYNGVSFTSHITTNTLTVSYDPALGGAFYNDLATLEVAGGYVAQVKVLSIYDNNAHASTAIPPANLYMEIETDAERYYNMDFVNAPNTGSSALNITYLPASEEYEIRWPYIAGAEEYDLEWTWVSDNALSPYIVAIDFKNNSTRVRTSDQHYRISNIFETGRVFFRIRGVGMYDQSGTGVYDTPYFTPWTAPDYLSFSLSTFISAYPCPTFPLPSNTITSEFFCVTADHEGNKNWQYKSTYAEDGKKKEVISYFDGTLRSRQSVTKVNSDNNAIVGETFYDYQGRAAVQALPVPVQDARIKFYQYNVTSSSSVSGWGYNFSKTTKEPFSRVHFDEDLTPGSCTPVGIGMEDNLAVTIGATTYGVGAANYYSPYNLDKTFQQGYVPDAENYPYTQTEFTPDNTGRVARQSGVGPEHKLGTGHETKYFYGSPTMQTELDRLFGSDVGDYKHYKKNMVIDANGQVSVTYLDQEGRTVATALAGKSPANLNILASNTGTTSFGGDLLNKDNPGDVDDDQDNNILDQGGKELTFSKDMLVTDEGDYTFGYDMTGTAFTYSCTAASICYDCIYDLEINIVDKCGANPTGFTPLAQKVGNILPEQIDGNGNITYNYTCDGPIEFSSPPNSLKVHLTPGSYTVYKKLAIDEDALSAYLEHYIDHNPCIRTEQDFIDSAKAHVDTSGCHLTCEQCVQALGTQASYIAGGGTADEYDRLVKECREPCEYTSSCEAAYIALLADMSPGGQYAEWENNNTCDPAAFPLSILNFGNHLNNRGALPSWKAPDIGGTGGQHYFDDDGTISYVQVVLQPGVTPSYVPAVDPLYTPVQVSGNTYQVEPHQLSDPCEFKNRWKNSWAQSLVKYHPEYFYYEWCIRNTMDNRTANNYTVTYNSNPGPILSSDHYDSLLVEVEDLALITSPVTQLLDPLGRAAGSSFGVVSDPYFDPAEPVAGHWYTSIKTSSVVGSPIPQLTGGPFIGNMGSPNLYWSAQQRFDYYLNSPLNLWEFTYVMVMGYAQQYTTAITPTSTCFPTSVTHDYHLLLPASNPAITVAQSKEAWKKFKFMYLSMKQSMQNEAAQSYALNYSPTGSVADIRNSCNDCIGQSSFSFLSVPFGSWVAGYGLFPGWITNWFLMPVNGIKAPCGLATSAYYTSKIKRFESTQEILDMGNGIDAAATIYQETGKCPQLLDVEAMLNALGQSSQLAATTNLQTLNGFTQNLYNFLYNNVNGMNPATYPGLTWTPSVSGSVLTAGFGSNLGGTCNMVLTFPSNAQGYDWTNTGTGSSLITHVYGITFLSYSAGQSTFTIKLDVSTPTHVYTYLVNGTVCGNLNSCSFPVPCKPNSTAYAFRNLFNQISEEARLCAGSSTSLMSPPFDATFNNILPTLPAGGSWVWNKTSASGGIISDASSTTPFTIGMASNVAGDFQTKLCPASGHVISIQSIVPDPTGSTGSFILKYSDTYTVAPSVTTGTMAGILYYKTTTSGPAIGYDLGTCGLPSPLCQTDEHHAKTDLEAFLTQNSISSVLTSSTAINITNGYHFSSLLGQYVAGSSNIANNSSASVTLPNFFWIKNNLASDAGNLVASICSATTTTAPVNTEACCKVVLSFSNTAASSSYNIQSATAYSNLVVLNSPTTGGQQYTFTMTATFSGGHTEPLIGYTTCIPIRECLSCDGTASGTSAGYYEEHFTGFTGLSFTLPGRTFDPACFSGGSSFSTKYYVISSAAPPEFCWYGQNMQIADHTGYPGSEFMLVPFNISPPGFSNVTLFDKTIAVTAGTTYNFSAYVNENIQSLGPINVSVTINGVTVGSGLSLPPTTTSAPPTWQHLALNWTATTSSANVKILISNSGCIGVVALDDIKFSGQQTATPCTDPLVPDTMPNIPYINPCVASAMNAAISDGLEHYNNYIDSLKADFVQQYIKKCMGGAVETFTLQYSANEYHYTLYYYDQAGNLVQTVPPQGVNIVTSPADLTQAKYDRAHPAVAKTFFTTHSMATTYAYNSLNQLEMQITPDAGTSYFWYDKLGRLIASQNAEQRFQSATNANIYSYTSYDYLGRIGEVGQMTVSPELLSVPYATLQSDLNPTTNDYPANLAPVKEQVTKTYYGDDLTYFGTVGTIPAPVFTSLVQSYARGRVVASTIETTDDANNLTYNYGTYYSYDVHGNVKELVQHNPDPDLVTLGQAFKVMNYNYDLVSGKVNNVNFQPGQPDQFYHRYEYDADNRITNVYTSKDNVTWDQDAKYFYYKHGPLARTETGDAKVQGTDYAYTLHGWIKGVNSNRLNEANDIGKDGNASGAPTNYNILHQQVARDAYGYNLDYYSGSGFSDYKAIDLTLTASTNFIANAGAVNIPTIAPSLFNGNISAMVTSYLNQDPTAINPGTGAPVAINAAFPQLTAYHYDQLNRINHLQAYKDFNTAANTWNPTPDNAYEESFSYDANGNILGLNRNGNSGAMDQLLYSYYDQSGGIYTPNPAAPSPMDATNKLAYVSDAVSGSAYATDIDDQAINNYTYDHIGNLIEDDAEKLASIEWTVYGKIKKITPNSGSGKPVIEFAYDPQGNRISKTVTFPRASSTNYYVRDAQGNVMAVYLKQPGPIDVPVFDLQEQHVYGSSRLGILNHNLRLTPLPAIPVVSTRTLGTKNYELSNHLGNVIAVINDKKIPEASCKTCQDMKTQYDNFVLAYGAITPANITSFVSYANTNLSVSNSQADYEQALKDCKLITNVLLFNGTNTSAASTSAANFNLGNGDVSVEGWVNIQASTSGYNIIMSNIQSIGSNIHGVMLFALNNQLYFAAYDGGTNGAAHIGSTNTSIIPYGQWVHVAATKTGSGPAAFAMYVNGVSVPYITYNTDAPDAIGMTNSAALETGFFSPGGDYANGYFRNNRIYNRALSASEIAANYSGGCMAEPATSIGLIYYGKLNEGSGTTFNDYSGNNLSSAISNGTWSYVGMPGSGCLSASDLAYALPAFSNALTTIGHYVPEVVNVSDYYAFGAVMPGRSFTSGNYRYGFGGKEKDDEIKGDGNSLDFGARINDPRLGRWLSVDPLAHKYPWQSPYCSMDNNPIANIDPTGMGTEDFVKDKAGNIRWDKDANSQATTKEGETYLGKELTFTFNSFISKKNWDGPDPPGGTATGNKLTTTIKLSATENEKGEITGLVAESKVKIGETPMGVARDYYPGAGGKHNIFAFGQSKKEDGTLGGFAMNFEQHASVSPVEELAINGFGYKIVDVAQKLNITYAGGKLRVTSATDVFPSATLDIRGENFWGGFRAMSYPQPSFKATHAAPVKMSSFNQPEGLNFDYYPSKFYKR